MFIHRRSHSSFTTLPSFQGAAAVPDEARRHARAGLARANRLAAKSPQIEVQPGYGRADGRTGSTLIARNLHHNSSPTSRSG